MTMTMSMPIIKGASIACRQNAALIPYITFMRPRLRPYCLSFTLLLLFSVVPLRARAQGAERAKPSTALPALLKVSTRLVPPFVMKQNGKLDGFSIELWQSIARELKVKSQFSVHDGVGDLLAAVKPGGDDLGIAAISITAERDKKFDFSQPIYDAGLQILVRDDGAHGNAPSLLSVIFSKQLLQLIGMILLLILVPAHLIYFFERRYKNGITEDEPYFPGIFNACWWAAGTLATQADEMPKSPLGRIVGVIWMFTSVIFVAYFTATITASQTVQQLRGDISGPGDLPGKRVATTRGSTSALYLQQHHVRIVEYTQIPEAYHALLNHQADAVVYDAPVLLYYTAHEGNGKARVVGSVFRKESYGIVFPNGSPLRRPVNNALLLLKENGTYERLLDKWFSAGEPK